MDEGRDGGDKEIAAGLCGAAFAAGVLPLVLFGVYAGYYFLAHSEEVPLTGRQQVVELSRADEARLGAQSYRQILAQERIVTGTPEARRVEAIGRRLQRALGDDDPGFTWEFALVESDAANAFCLPGGKVAVYTGILPIAANDDGLAAIMGHEIAHAIARHGAERMAHQKLAQLGQLAAGSAVSDMSPETRALVLGAFGVGAQVGVLLPFSRDHESEADYMGLIYAARACFDPREAPQVWQRMAAHGRGQPPAFLSTHPSHQTRIAQLTGWMDKAAAERPATCPAMP